MQLGEWGTVATTRQVLAEDGKTWQAAPEGSRTRRGQLSRWRARARVRDLDG